MDTLKKNLLQFHRKTISFDELQELAAKNLNYEQFAQNILLLEEAKILQMIQSQGRNNLTPSLAYRYRIHKQVLNKAHYEELTSYRLKFHNAINLDKYFELDASIWQKDLPYLERINDYLEGNGYPKEKVPAPERSFELVANEKWIEEEGETVLRRIHLWDALQIMPVADPLMFAINPAQVTAEKANHLIVENKTTYQALLAVLQESTLATLIYGAGNKINKTIENFDHQIPTEADHHIFYFGDIDREGINIWHRLRNKRVVKPAFPFYKACLAKKAARGKMNQRKDMEAISAFLDYFPKGEAEVIRQLLEDGFYYPQEVLQTLELQDILRRTDWEAWQLS